MTLAGRRFEVPGGGWVVITRAGEERAARWSRWSSRSRPARRGPPPHRHSQQVEEWDVLDGVLSVRIGGRSRTLSAGESATIPPGTVHTFRNASSSAVRVRDVHRPGFGFDEYIATLGRLAEAGKLRSLRDPRAAIYLSMVWRDHREMQVADSALLLRAAMTALAGLGRLLGLRTTAA